MRDLDDDRPVHDVSTAPRTAHLPSVSVPPRHVTHGKGRVVASHQAGHSVVADVVRRVAVVVWPPKGPLEASLTSFAAAVVTELHSLVAIQATSLIRSATFVVPLIGIDNAITSTAITIAPITSHRHQLTVIISPQHTAAATILTSIIIVRPRGRSVPTTATVAGRVPFNPHDNNSEIRIDAMSSGVTQAVPRTTVQCGISSGVAGRLGDMVSGKRSTRPAGNGLGGAFSTTEDADPKEEPDDPAEKLAHAARRAAAMRAARIRG